MKKSIQSRDDIYRYKERMNTDNLRACPSCGLESLKGMSGGKDSICENCGYKDPCCYD